MISGDALCEIGARRWRLKVCGEWREAVWMRVGELSGFFKGRVKFFDGLMIGELEEQIVVRCEWKKSGNWYGEV